MKLVGCEGGEAFQSTPNSSWFNHLGTNRRSQPTNQGLSENSLGNLGGETMNQSSCSPTQHLLMTSFLEISDSWWMENGRPLINSMSLMRTWQAAELMRFWGPCSSDNKGRCHQHESTCYWSANLLSMMPQLHRRASKWEELKEAC